MCPVLVCGAQERNMMDIRVFHPSAPSYKTLKSLFKTQEQQKKREYNNSRVLNKEKSTFTPNY